MWWAILTQRNNLHVTLFPWCLNLFASSLFFCFPETWHYVAQPILKLTMLWALECCIFLILCFWAGSPAHKTSFQTPTLLSDLAFFWQNWSTWVCNIPRGLQHNMTFPAFLWMQSNPTSWALTGFALLTLTGFYNQHAKLTSLPKIASLSFSSSPCGIIYALLHFNTCIMPLCSYCDKVNHTSVDYQE